MWIFLWVLVTDIRTNIAEIHVYTVMVTYRLQTSWCLYLFAKLPDSKVHGANMGPTWFLSDPDGPHVRPMNLVIKLMCSASVVVLCFTYNAYSWWCQDMEDLSLLLALCEKIHWWPLDSPQRELLTWCFYNAYFMKWIFLIGYIWRSQFHWVHYVSNGQRGYNRSLISHVRGNSITTFISGIHQKYCGLVTSYGVIELFSTGSGNGLLPHSTKQYLYQILVDYQWDPAAFTWGKFHRKSRLSRYL